ncbi:zinc ribbon domain-containing protein [Paracoccus cavernae]|uniref:Zinc ribbon domain-containing protein n=1 Tax=Paracoccus cavernae TaxID=1571207 RepID=A0ABT8DEV2_9RHOB|nr:zinc ribbon domain-containing protein [Paracoccus cavernae]
MTAPFEMRFCPNCAHKLALITLHEDSGPTERLRCANCGWTHWGNPTPVLAAVLENDQGEVLIARNALWEEGVFGLITGFMEAGESPRRGFAARHSRKPACAPRHCAFWDRGIPADESGDCRLSPARRG